MKNKRIFLFLLILSGISSVYAQNTTVYRDTVTPSDSILSIHLHEVKVTARENQSASTSSFISKEAIQHIQSFSLSNLMQLLPGGTTPSVSVLSPTYFTIRHLGSTSVNSLGTGINIDGVRLSTNADLRANPENTILYNINSGYDTREIPTDNIESVEVIRGIPSVQYGDITSGMVVVHTRKDIRPYSISLRLTPGIKSFNAAKGWQLRKGGILNLNTGYTNSSPSLTNSESIYHRIHVESGFNRQYNHIHPLSIETGISGTITIHNNPTNQELQPGEFLHAGNQAFRFRFSGKWDLQGQIINTINWNTSVSYEHALIDKNSYTSTTYSVGTDATDDREQQGFFIPPQYWQRNRTESKPIYGSAKIYTTSHHKGNNWSSHSTIGIEWNTDGNIGKGKTKEYHTPSLPAQGQYDYRDIPFMHNYALYVEEALQIKRFSLTGGVRLTGISIHGLHFPLVADPRLNISYSAIQQSNSKGLRLLRLKGGIGILHKMPTSGYLFSQSQYENIVSYRYRNEESGNALAVMTTFVSEQQGAEALKLPRNLKAEAGIAGIIGNFSFDITAFYERLTNGFDKTSFVRPAAYRIYNTGNEKDSSPEYNNGEVHVNGQPVGYKNDTTFINNTIVNNSFFEYTQGLEFTFRSDYIPVLATTFILDGAWMISRQGNKDFSTSRVLQSSGNRSYPMCAIFDNSVNINKRQRISTTLRAVTEIPALRLTTTLALQSIWFEQSQSKIKKNAANLYYMKDSDGNRVYENLDKDTETIKYLDPAYYMDTQGQIHRFTQELANDPAFSPMIQQVYSRKFMLNSYAPYFLLNLRVTKDIGKQICLSFFANNLASMNPKRYVNSSGQYQLMNPSAFFGLELQIKL